MCEHETGKLRYYTSRFEGKYMNVRSSCVVVTIVLVVVVVLDGNHLSIRVDNGDNKSDN